MKISLLAPAFNEEETIDIFYQEIQQNFIAYLPKDEVEIVLVNDGSSDSTEQVITNLCEKDNRVKLINFSRNFGKDPALMAGFHYVTGDVVIPLDIDLQDPLGVALEFVKMYKEDPCDVIVGQRKQRQDSKLKAFIAKCFYFIYNATTETKIQTVNSSEFRLMSRRVIDEIKKFPDREIFVRSALDWIGFSRKVIPFDRVKRSAGTPKFNFLMSLRYAIKGFVSFCSLPLTAWVWIGSFFLFLSLILVVGAVFLKISTTLWIVIAIMFFSGLQLCALGVIGRYLWMVAQESKGRPAYIIKDTVGF